MPHEEMNEQQVAAYLHIDGRELAKLASRGQIPCRKVGGKFRFTKSDVDHWIELSMPQLDKRRLAGIEKGVSRHHGFAEEELLLHPLIPDDGLAVPLDARTADAVIRALVDQADRAGVVHARAELLNEIRQREQLCTTAMLPAVAIPHPRHPLPYDIARSFVVVGVTTSGIPFGAEDGSLTRLFFLVCCKDDRTHLHVLARLARIFHEPGAIEDFIDSPDAEQLAERILRHEQAALARPS